MNIQIKVGLALISLCCVFAAMEVTVRVIQFFRNRSLEDSRFTPIYRDDLIVTLGGSTSHAGNYPAKLEEILKQQPEYRSTFCDGKTH